MNSKSTVTLKKLVMAALFAALACVATMSIKIPTPGTSGYIHPGDAIVILAGVFSDLHGDSLAGGIGSAMADLLGGYFVYGSDHICDQRTGIPLLRSSLP